MGTNRQPQWKQMRNGNIKLEWTNNDCRWIQWKETNEHNWAVQWAGKKVGENGADACGACRVYVQFLVELEWADHTWWEDEW